MNTHKKIAILSLMAILTAGASAADLVVVGHPSAQALTKDQVADIFLGKNLSMTPVDQVSTAPVRTEFYRRATGRDPTQIKAVWSRLVFSGKAQLPKELPDSASVKRAVASDPKMIGYIDKAEVDGSVKVLATVD